MKDNENNIDEKDEMKLFLDHPPTGTRVRQPFFERYGVGFTIAFFLLLSLASPWLFTRFVSGMPQFVDTGQIGDTIGGLTAPVIGILNVVLLWWTLRKQGQQISEQNLQNRIERLTNKMEGDLNSLNLNITDHSVRLTAANYRGKELLLRVMDLYSHPQSLAPVVIDKMDLKIFQVHLEDTMYLANRITALNLMSSSSFEDKISTYYEIKNQFDLVFSLLDRLSEFCESYKDDSTMSRFVLSARFIRNMKRQKVIFTSRDPNAIRYPKLIRKFYFPEEN